MTRQVLIADATSDWREIECHPGQFVTSSSRADVGTADCQRVSSLQR